METIVWVLILPLLGALLSFVFAAHAKKISLVFALLWLLAASLLLFQTSSGAVITHDFAGFAPPLGIRYSAWPMGALMLTLSALIFTAVTVYTCFYPKVAASFYPLFWFLGCGFGVVFLSDDIFNLYVGLEIITLAAVGLTAYGKKRVNIQAALDYFVAAMVGSGFYLLGVALLYAQHGTLDITMLADAMKKDYTSGFAFLMLVLALGIKTALFPFHFWLPKAHASAAPFVSALLSALVVKVGFYLLYRLYFEVFAIDLIGAVLGWLGIAAIFYGAVAALMAKDIKLLIAYSTLSQLGYLFLVFTLQSQLAKQGVLLHIIAHGLAKGGMFLAAGAIIAHTASTGIKSIKGAASLLPVSVFALGLSTVTITGLPPSLGFGAKWHLLLAALQTQSWAVAAAVVLGGMLSAAYLFKLLILALQTPKTNRLPRTPPRGAALQWPGFVLSFASVALGFGAHLILDLGGM